MPSRFVLQCLSELHGITGATLHPPSPVPLCLSAFPLPTPPFALTCLSTLPSPLPPLPVTYLPPFSSPPMISFSLTYLLSLPLSLSPLALSSACHPFLSHLPITPSFVPVTHIRDKHTHTEEASTLTQTSKHNIGTSTPTTLFFTCFIYIMAPSSLGS